MSHAPPLVSVIVMCRRNEPFLAEALNSVLSEHSDVSLEIVVANSGLEDSERFLSEEISPAARSQILFVGGCDSSQGPATLAETIDLCRGTFAAFADTDAVWDTPCRLQSQVDFLQRHPSYIGCCHPVQTVHPAGFRPRPGDPIVPPETLTFEDALSLDTSLGCSAMVRLQAAAAPSVVSIEDPDESRWAWILQCLTHGDFAFIETLTATRRREAARSSSAESPDWYHRRNRLLRRVRRSVRPGHRIQVERQLSAHHAQIAAEMDRQIRPEVADRHRQLSFGYARWSAPLPFATRLSHAIRPCRSLHSAAVWSYESLNMTRRRIPFARFLITTLIQQPSWLLRLGRSLLRQGVPGLRRELCILDYLFGVSRQQYRKWTRAFDVITDADRQAIRERITSMPTRPVFSVLMPTCDTDPSMLRRAVDSVLNQLYPHWQLCIADDASDDEGVRRILRDVQDSDQRVSCTFREERGNISAASNSALQLANGDFVVLLDHDDELSEHALYYIAEELNHHPDADVIYSDEDRIDTRGRRVDPYFKPDWNPDLLLSQNMICHLAAIRSTLIREAGGFRCGLEGSQDHDLMLRCTEHTSEDRIRHVPAILYHWRMTPGSVSSDSRSAEKAHQAGVRAIADHLKRRQIDAAVELIDDKGAPHYRVKYALPDPPLVSIIVPTRDSLLLLRRCVDGLLQHTDYPHLEILIVDNGSSEPATLEYLASLESQPTVRVLEYSGRFNFSAINNYAVSQAAGSVLCLLNNDTEVIHTDWLTEMVSHVMRPETGAVGAKLLYPDDCVQHAGVLVGFGGGAGHTFSGLPVETPVQHGRLDTIQNVSSVTAACMVLKKSVYNEVGGLDEDRFSVGYNDVDLCLRIIQAGYRIVWTPYARLYHHESASRGKSRTVEQIERDDREGRALRHRWKERIAADPCLNPNVSIHHQDYRPAFPPRSQRPWC